MAPFQVRYTTHCYKLEEKSELYVHDRVYKYALKVRTICQNHQPKSEGEIGCLSIKNCKSKNNDPNHLFQP